ncbi:hypothetical protein PoB_006889900 [Plakobranchus ocellatus]|uniref:Uncharacterized protein n=1 Tax=Plakobranchus ocellatus TaxID=259542 RepID=A0AAV4DDW4_9GAST|nr:hypothetical protein PoB_006889900 [Plakobranchus ocellatus]
MAQESAMVGASREVILLDTAEESVKQNKLGWTTHKKETLPGEPTNFGMVAPDRANRRNPHRLTWRGNCKNTQVKV